MYIVIFITTSGKKEAQKIAQALIKKRLAACVNIIGNVQSLFWWQARVDRAKEALLIVKSKRIKLAQIIKLVKTIHSYQVPEIIALPIIEGNKDYLNWIDGSC
jgi:periplasmic divalent cation tolerance protein